MPDSGIPQTCKHERRPGTTTCLYCLQEERARASARRRRALARFSLLALGGGAAIALLIGVVTVLAPDSSSVAVKPEPVTVEQTGSVTTPPARTPRPPERKPPVAPIIASGSRELGEGVVVTRSENEVIVNFDTDQLRTRFDWKFEAVVRSTLPAIYGDVARTALDSVPTGGLVRGDLLEVLPDSGIALALAEGDTLILWPLTRPGRDGPIVVAYRATTR